MAEVMPAWMREPARVSHIPRMRATGSARWMGGFGVRYRLYRLRPLAQRSGDEIAGGVAAPAEGELMRSGGGTDVRRAVSDEWYETPSHSTPHRNRLAARPLARRAGTQYK